MHYTYSYRLAFLNGKSSQEIYGGVTTRAACSNLPPYPICGQYPQDNMINLCQFSWDKGFRKPPNIPGQSGNPQIRRICQVACPQQLYLATGLRRVDETNKLYTCNNNLEPTGGYVTKTMDCSKSLSLLFRSII